MALIATASQCVYSNPPASTKCLRKPNRIIPDDKSQLMISGDIYSMIWYLLFILFGLLVCTCPAACHLATTLKFTRFVSNLVPIPAPIHPVVHAPYAVARELARCNYLGRLFERNIFLYAILVRPIIELHMFGYKSTCWRQYSPSLVFYIIT